MKLSTLLLSSAALVVAGSAYAADLPAKKGAPAAKAAATGCPAFGAGYWQIPGSDTCLQIGGFVRSNNSWTVSTTDRDTAPYSMSGAAYLWFDAKNNSEVGVVHSYIALYGTGYGDDNGVDEAFLQAGGFTAGNTGGVIDKLSTSAFSSHGMLTSYTTPQLTYTMPVGSSSFTVGIESANNTGNDVPSSRPDVVAAFNTKAGGVGVDVIGIAHEAPGADSGSVNGYVVGGKLTFETGGATFKVAGAYSQGYTYMVSNGGTYTDASDDAGSSSKGSMVAASVTVPMGGNSVSAGANQYNISDDAGAQTKWTNYRLAYKAVIAKGLFARPEYQISTGDTSSQTLFLRIQRDF